MAQHQHLPIYKTTYTLLETVTKKIKEFPKDFKHSLGDKILTECVDLVMLVHKANNK